MNIQKKIGASIFWGFYESAEIRFIEKYFKGNIDTIELGASIGVVSSHIVSKLKKSKRLFSVEANSSLSKVWLENVSRHKAHQEVPTSLVNSAISYGNEVVKFSVSNNTLESNILPGEGQDATAVEMRAITLGGFIEECGVKEYFLVCDIEGAEVQIFINETSSLERCSQIIIELHDTVYNGVAYKVFDIQSMIQNKGFELVANQGPVYYFNRIIKS